jgi:hypothetical protein
MHSFIENFARLYRKYISYYLPLFIQNVNLVIYLQIMIFGTYNIDKSSFEHHVYDNKTPHKMNYKIFKIRSKSN